jgi:hypothetical protein
MEQEMKAWFTPARKKMITDYALAVVASAVTMGVSLLIDLKPEYAVLIGAITAPAVKWAAPRSKDYGIGSTK